MMKKQQNYLEKVPERSSVIGWSRDDCGNVTLEIENKGFFNFIFQKLLKKPRISYVHLDATGSFVWPLIDGQKNVFQLGELVKNQFGDAAEPLYERLVKYFSILESYGFISWKK